MRYIVIIIIVATFGAFSLYNFGIPAWEECRKEHTVVHCMAWQKYNTFRYTWR